MRLIYAPTMLDIIQKELTSAALRGKIVKGIEVTRREWNEVEREVSTSCAMRPTPPGTEASLFGFPVTVVG